MPNGCWRTHPGPGSARYTVTVWSLSTVRGHAGAEEADAAVTACTGAALVVRTADCAPVGLASPEGIVAAVHAGWRGLMAGVVEEAVTAMRSLGRHFGDGRARAVHRGPRLQVLEAGSGACGRSLRAARRRHGRGRLPGARPAETVRAALGGAGAALVADALVCTHCSADHWSWRANRDTGRQATVVWVPAWSRCPCPRV